VVAAAELLNVFSPELENRPFAVALSAYNPRLGRQPQVWREKGKRRKKGKEGSQLR